MNYQEVSAQLVRACATGESDLGRAIMSEAVSTTALYFVPVGWFVAFAAAETLYTGIYDRQDLRLVGTCQYKFDELTPKSLDTLIGQMSEKLILWKLGLY